MKAILLFIFTSCTSLYCQSDYTPMLENENDWIVTLRGFGESWSFQVYTKADTTIGGQSYHRIRQIPAFTPNPSIGFLREDSISRKIYYYELDSAQSVSLQTEGVLYDFSLSEGEQAIIRNMGNDFSSFRTDTLILDSIRNTLPQNLHNGIFFTDSVKVYYLRSLNPLYGVDHNRIVWAEGLGSITGPLYSASEFDYPASLECAYRDKIPIYRSPYWFYGDSCYLGAISIDAEEYKPEITVSFNPVSEELHIVFDDVIERHAELKIIDLTGSLIYRKAVLPAEQKFMIDLKGYASGVYFILIAGAHFSYHRAFMK